jgi:hypothetical protein
MCTTHKILVYFGFNLTLIDNFDSKTIKISTTSTLKPCFNNLKMLRLASKVAMRGPNFSSIGKRHASSHFNFFHYGNVGIPGNRMKFK